MLHIDFGDCFEVAMQREKFPEKVIVTRICFLFIVLNNCDGLLEHTTCIHAHRFLISLRMCKNSIQILTFCQCLSVNVPTIKSLTLVPTFSLHATSTYLLFSGALPADAHAGECHGGGRHRGQLPLYLRECE